jgi:peptide deformylase
MIETMAEHHGAGLAAPQAHLDLRLFVAIADADDERGGKPIVLVNPEIALVGSDTVEDPIARTAA